MIKDLEIIYPRIEEQTVFATVVMETMRQKAKMANALSQMDNAFKSIMQRAFKGELFS